MSKPLTYYCGSRVDEPIFRELEKLLEKACFEDKISLAIGVLLMRTLPEEKYPFPARLVDHLRLTAKLSDDGKLDLAKALIDDARQQSK